MIALIALVLSIVTSLVMPNQEASAVVIIPAKPQVAPINNLEENAYDDAWCEFTNLFNSYEIKRARNGALMIRRGNSGSFKFAKKG